MPRGTKILMVDDDKMLIDLYKERLELSGYHVDVSRDGEEGLARVHELKPDLVLLDIMMPKVNGYEALASIKSDPATKDTPVIILSALMRDINKSKAVESGADDYIIKSEAMPADVIKKIEAVLKKYNKSAPETDNSKTDSKEDKEKVEEKPPLMQEITPPPPPPAAAPSPSAEINFEPAAGGQDVSQNPSQQVAPDSPPNPPQAVPDPQTPPPPATQNYPVVQPQSSPTVIFLLVLIVIIILAGDIFFYMRLFLVK